jgi:hypothetical protein
VVGGKVPCEGGKLGDGTPYLTVTNLKPGQFSY